MNLQIVALANYVEGPNMYVIKKSRQVHQAFSFFFQNFVKINMSIFGRLI